jgi:hypothetical protein
MDFFKKRIFARRLRNVGFLRVACEYDHAMVAGSSVVSSSCSTSCGMISGSP